MKFLFRLVPALLLVFPLAARAQRCSLMELPLETRIDAASLIVEGRVLESLSFIDEARSGIFTSNLVEVFKVFKGELHGHFIEVITEGGTVGSATEYLTNTLALHPGETGILFCMPARTFTSLRTTDSGIHAEIFGSKQGFIRYDEDLAEGNDPFHVYSDIDWDVRQAITHHTGSNYRVIRALPDAASGRTGKNSAGFAATPSISSFSPTTSPAGNDAVLTIYGSNFGATRGTGRVEFKNSNDGGNTWIYPLSTAYVSWSNTQIEVRIPSDAGTGQIRVRNSDPATGTSGSTLTIDFSWLNETISNVDYRTDFINDNSAGGYTWQMYTGFASNTPAMEAFIRAFENWRCNTNVNSGPNWEIGPNSSVNVIADDNVNIIRFDIGTELPSGVLGRTTLRWNNQNCPPMNAWCREIDMVFDSGTNWNFTTGNPSGAQIDFETVALHELGHAMQLGHIINSSGVMHYAVSFGVTKRVLASNDIAGGDSVLTESIRTNLCGPSAMTQLSGSVSSNSHICSGNSTNLLAKGGTSYSWTPTTGLSDPTIPNPVASPTRTTTYTVTITNGSCYSVTRSVTVSVPYVDAGPDVNVCPRSSVQIGGPAMDGTPPYTYSWSPATGLSNPSIAMPLASPAASTQYVVTVTDGSACAFRDTVIVSVSTLTADAGADDAMCPGGSVTLNGSATGGVPPYTYSWTPTAGLSDPTSAQPVASPASTTVYTLTVSDGASCSTSDSVRITVYPKPAANAGPDRTICSGGSVMIGSAPDPQNAYSWFPTSGLNNAGIADPMASPSATTTYVVTVTSPSGCTNTDTVTVTIFQSAGNDFTWTGAINTDWNTLGNWSDPCSLPQNGSNVTIPPATTPPINNPLIHLNTLILNNSAGLVLSNPISVDSLLSLVSGKLFLGNNELRVKSSAFISGGSASRYVVTNGSGELIQEGVGAGMRDTSVLFPVGANATRYSPASILNTLTPADFSVRVKDQVLTGATSGQPINTHVVGKTWFVSDGGSGANATVTLGWSANDELAGFNRSKSYVARHTGTLWSALQPAGSASGSNPYERAVSNCSAFGAFAIGDGDSPLPIELRSFSGRALGAEVLLEWETAQEINNFGFEIQRAADAATGWGSIGFVPGHGSSSAGYRYTFSDRPINLPRLLYRLVQIDQDGTRHVSSAVSVSLSVPSSEALNIYPNPVRRDRQSGIHLSNPFGEGGPVELTVFNHLGEEVFRESFTDGGPIELPTGSLGAGAYFILLRRQGVISTASFLVLD